MSGIPGSSPKKPAPEKPVCSGDLRYVRLYMTSVYIQGFLGLSREDAEAVERMADDIAYTEEEEKAVRRKIDFRILPIVVLTYICTSFCLLWMLNNC